MTGVRAPCGRGARAAWQLGSGPSARRRQGIVGVQACGPGLVIGDAAGFYVGHGFACQPLTFFLLRNPGGRGLLYDSGLRPLQLSGQPVHLVHLVRRGTGTCAVNTRVAVFDMGSASCKRLINNHSG